MGSNPPSFGTDNHDSLRQELDIKKGIGHFSGLSGIFWSPVPFDTRSSILALVSRENRHQSNAEVHVPATRELHVDW